MRPSASTLTGNGQSVRSTCLQRSVTNTALALSNSSWRLISGQCEPHLLVSHLHGHVIPRPIFIHICLTCDSLHRLCSVHHVNVVMTTDGRNNSAWNHRFFLIKHTTGFTPNVLADEVAYVFHGSVPVSMPLLIHMATCVLTHPAPSITYPVQCPPRYTLDKLKRAPNNESAWNYLEGSVHVPPFIFLPCSSYSTSLL
jgi:hypothetical protein